MAGGSDRTVDEARCSEPADDGLTFVIVDIRLARDTVRAVDPLDPRMIDCPAALDALVDEVGDEASYAIDTEFIRERTYHAELSLVQVAWSGGVAVIDPLQVDIRPLARLFARSGLAVLHAATADLEIFAHYTGSLPKRIFDTQIAGAFLGHGQASLANLLRDELDITISKSEQLSDWRLRPLPEAAIAYAAGDVAHLLALHEKMMGSLVARGRREWVEEECERLRTRDLTPPDPRLCWWKLKGRSRLPPESLGVAQALAAYRERESARYDVPPRFFMADLPLLAMAHKPPRSREELETVRGLNHKHLKAQNAAALLESIREGLQMPPEALRLPPPPESAATVALATLCSAWVAQRAADEQIDGAMLATRDELSELVESPADSRVTRGFRRMLVGQDLERIIRGEVAIGVDSTGRLQLR